MRILAVIWGSWRLYEDHGGYIVDPGGYMRILAVICSGVGSRDTCVSKNENNCYYCPRLFL